MKVFPNQPDPLPPTCLIGTLTVYTFNQRRLAILARRQFTPSPER